MVNEDRMIYIFCNEQRPCEDKYGYTTDPEQRLNANHEQFSSPSTCKALFNIKETNKFKNFRNKNIFPKCYEQYDKIISLNNTVEKVRELEKKTHTTLNNMKKLVPFLQNNGGGTELISTFGHRQYKKIFYRVMFKDFKKLGLIATELDYNDILQSNNSKIETPDYYGFDLNEGEILPYNSEEKKEEKEENKAKFYSVFEKNKGLLNDVYSKGQWDKEDEKIKNGKKRFSFKAYQQPILNTFCRFIYGSDWWKCSQECSKNKCENCTTKNNERKRINLRTMHNYIGMYFKDLKNKDLQLSPRSILDMKY